MKSKSSNGHTTSYEYDALGSLRSVTLPDGMKIEYIIDGTNRRIGKKIDGALVCGWLYMDGLRLAAELDANNQVVSAFIYGSHAHVPDLMVRGGVVYRILTDHRGSPRLIVNSQTAQIVQRLDYDVFGNVILDTNPGFQPFGFAGGLYDPDTGLTRFGVRDYDAETGRWTTPDPFVFDGDPSNVYRYALNDPINYIDPAGVLESNVETIRETLWALANEETRIGGWANMKAAYGEVDCTEHALFGDPIMRYYPPPWPWDPKPYERVMASGGRFLPKRDHNIRMEKLKSLGMDDGDLDLRWFVHGYLSTTNMFHIKLGTGVAYNVATGRGFSSAGANTNNKSLILGQIVRQLGLDLGDFAQIISGGPPADTRYQQGAQFPPNQGFMIFVLRELFNAPRRGLMGLPRRG